MARSQGRQGGLAHKHLTLPPAFFGGKIHIPHLHKREDKMADTSKKIVPYIRPLPNKKFLATGLCLLH
jgi:hypothetical protein